MHLILRVNFFGFSCYFLILGVAAFASGEIRQSARKRATVCSVLSPGLFHRLIAIDLLVNVLAILAITAGLFFFLPRTARGVSNIWSLIATG